MIGTGKADDAVLTTLTSRRRLPSDSVHDTREPSAEYGIDARAIPFELGRRRVVGG